MISLPGYRNENCKNCSNQNFDITSWGREEGAVEVGGGLRFSAEDELKLLEWAVSRHISNKN